MKKKIIKLFKILEEDLELAINSLPSLFSCENVVTRTQAAAHCLSLNICVHASKKVLEEVAKGGGRIFGFNAKMTLKIWREQGYLKVYPTQVIRPEKID